MNYLSGSVLILGVALTPGSIAADADLAVVNRIKDQAFNHSRVVDYMHYLADENGPRLAASPGYQRAARWAVDTLKQEGIESARLETFGEIGRSWAWSGISVQMVEPQATTLSAVPLAWSPGTEGTIEAPVVYAPLWADAEDPGQGDLVLLAERIAAYRNEFAGKLGGKIVLLSPRRPFELPSEPEILRWSAADLEEMQTARDPLLTDVREWPLLRLSLDTEERWLQYEVVPAEIQSDYSDRQSRLMDRLIRFLNDEQAAAVMMTNTEGHGGVIGPRPRLARWQVVGVFALEGSRQALVGMRGKESLAKGVAHAEPLEGAQHQRCRRRRHSSPPPGGGSKVRPPVPRKAAAWGCGRGAEG